jgi:hypothetical protein
MQQCTQFPLPLMMVDFMDQEHQIIPLNMLMLLTANVIFGFVHYLQFFVFPRVSKCLGFRHTYKLGCVLFGISSIILPLSNRISGPISYSSEDIFSGSGSGGGLSPFFVYNDSCGNLINTTDGFSGANSVSRVPARVWAVIMTITVATVFSRYDVYCCSSDKI